MHGNLDLILTLTGGLAAALMLGYLAHRLGLSPIVGYLLAGILVGPHTPGFVADQHLAEQLAEVGVILLMFGVGLHFHIKELWAVRRIALPGAVVQSLVGRTLSRLLRDNEIEPTIIEMNLKTVHRLREAGLEAVYGDAGHRDTLKAAGVERSRVFCSPPRACTTPRRSFDWHAS